MIAGNLQQIPNMRGPHDEGLHDGGPPDGGPPYGLPPDGPHGPGMPIYVIILVYSMMIIIGSLGNIATIIAFALDSKVRSKPSDLIILALAVADAYICIFEMPIIMAEKINGPGVVNEVGCKIDRLLSSSCVNAGINLIVILSWDRYLMLAKPYGDYIKIQTRRRIICLITMAWVYAVIPGIIEIAIWDLLISPKKLKSGLTYHRNSTYVYFCVPASAQNDDFQKIELYLLRLVPIGLVCLFGVMFLIHLRRRLLRWKRVNIRDVVATSSVSPAGPSCTNNKGALGQSNDHKTSVFNPSVNSDGRIDRNVSFETINQKKSAKKNQSEDEMIKVSTITKSNKNLSYQNSSNFSLDLPGNSTKNNNHIQNRSKPADIMVPHAMERKHYIKPTIMYITLVMAVLICTTPLNLYTLLVLECHCHRKPSAIIIETLLTLLWFNSCLNPIMYALTNKKLRQFYTKKLQKLCRRY